MREPKLQDRAASHDRKQHVWHSEHNTTHGGGVVPMVDSRQISWTGKHVLDFQRSINGLSDSWWAYLLGYLLMQTLGQGLLYSEREIQHASDILGMHSSTRCQEFWRILIAQTSCTRLGLGFVNFEVDNFAILIMCVAERVPRTNETYHDSYRHSTKKVQKKMSEGR